MTRAAGPLAALTVVLAVAAAALGGALAYRVNRTHPGAVPAGPSPAPWPAAGATAGEAAQPRRIPEQLPAIVLPDLRGLPRDVREWRGRPVLVNFWATWCEPCRREIPLLQRLRRDRAAQGLEIIGVAVDFPDAVRQYVAAAGIQYPVLVGEDGGLAAISALGLDTVLPFTVFADGQGRILTVKVGELHADEAALMLDELRDVELGRATPAAARAALATRLPALAVQRAHSER